MWHWKSTRFSTTHDGDGGGETSSVPKLQSSCKKTNRLKHNGQNSEHNVESWLMTTQFGNCLPCFWIKLGSGYWKTVVTNAVTSLSIQSCIWPIYIRHYLLPKTKDGQVGGGGSSWVKECGWSVSICSASSWRAGFALARFGKAQGLAWPRRSTCPSDCCRAKYHAWRTQMCHRCKSGHGYVCGWKVKSWR